MKTAFRWFIQFYRLCISPMLGPRCRFYPSCSAYALEALEQHSLSFALWLIIKRLGRCQPWGGSGYDPVPLEQSAVDKSTQSKKNSVIKLFLIQFLNVRRICNCDVDKHAIQIQSATQKSLIQPLVNNDRHGYQSNHQSCHQNLKFIPYTPPPYHHLLFI